MTLRRWLLPTTAALACVLATPPPAAAQEASLKGGVSVSHLRTEGVPFWDESLVATQFGGHVRFRVGRIMLQPELHVVTKGARSSFADEEEQLRLEYIELPLLLAVPVRVGTFEPFAYGGPSLMLESRCRWIIRQDGLRTNVGCEPPPTPQVFSRRTFDYGLVAGAGVAHRLGAGQLMVEARHTWGMRNIHSGPQPGEARNRTVAVMLGYSLNWEADAARRQ